LDIHQKSVTLIGRQNSHSPQESITPNQGNSVDRIQIPDSATTDVYHSPAFSNPTLKQQAKKAFQMILLISGAFWGTYIPGNLIIASVFALGYTWEDVDDRSHMTMFIIIRVSVYLVTFVSSAVNPLIHYYSRRDLRMAFCKMVGWK
jgi:hypothetical protein